MAAGGPPPAYADGSPASVDGPFGCADGGSSGLRRLLEEHGEAIEADLERFYGIRLSQAVQGSPQGRYSARELLNRIHQLPPESTLMRKLKGPMAAWDVNALLSRQILLAIQGGNWQRGGGKGQKPKPVALPDSNGRGDKPASTKASGADIARRLANLGLIPAGATD